LVLNWNQVPLQDIIRPIFITALFGTLLCLLALRISKNIHKSAFLASLFFIFFFSHRHLISLVIYLRGADRSSFLYTSNLVSILWLCIWVSLFVLLSYLVVRSKRDFLLTTSFLNVISFALIAIFLIQLVPHIRDSRVSAFIDAWEEEIAEQGHTNDATLDSLPDIYYIILDGYAGADILRDFYDFDNSEFLAYLTETGFVSEHDVPGQPG
jgi:hypothetical protein